MALGLTPEAERDSHRPWNNQAHATHLCVCGLQRRSSHKGLEKEAQQDKPNEASTTTNYWRGGGGGEMTIVTSLEPNDETCETCGRLLSIFHSNTKWLCHRQRLGIFLYRSRLQPDNENDSVHSLNTIFSFFHFCFFSLFGFLNGVRKISIWWGWVNNPALLRVERLVYGNFLFRFSLAVFFSPSDGRGVKMRSRCFRPWQQEPDVPTHDHHHPSHVKLPSWNTNSRHLISQFNPSWKFFNNWSSLLFMFHYYQLINK